MSKPADAHSWSAVKLKAWNQRERNPNTYYYRFNEPGQSQKSGPWSEEEKKAFLERLQEMGGKAMHNWGIFSKTIIGRVGYQCAAFYRKLVKDGEIVDEHYHFDEKGRLVKPSNTSEKKNQRSSHNYSKDDFPSIFGESDSGSTNDAFSSGYSSISSSTNSLNSSPRSPTSNRSSMNSKNDYIIKDVPDIDVEFEPRRRKRSSMYNYNTDTSLRRSIIRSNMNFPLSNNESFYMPQKVRTRSIQESDLEYFSFNPQNISCDKINLLDKFQRSSLPNLSSESSTAVEESLSKKFQIPLDKQQQQLSLQKLPQQRQKKYKSQQQSIPPQKPLTSLLGQQSLLPFSQNQFQYTSNSDDLSPILQQQQKLFPQQNPLSQQQQQQLQPFQSEYFGQNLLGSSIQKYRVDEQQLKNSPRVNSQDQEQLQESSPPYINMDYENSPVIDSPSTIQNTVDNNPLINPLDTQNSQLDSKKCLAYEKYFDKSYLNSNPDCYQSLDLLLNIPPEQEPLNSLDPFSISSFEFNEFWSGTEYL